MELNVKVINIPMILPENNGCTQCVERLRENLLKLRGIAELGIQKNGHEMEIKYDPNFISLEKIEEKAQEIGIHLVKQYKHEFFVLEGLDCPDCASKLETSVSRLKGVTRASVNFAAGKIWIEYEPDLITLSEISANITDLGYGVKDLEEEIGEDRSIFQVSGLDCPDCVAKLERRISKIEGIKEAIINFNLAEMVIRHEKRDSIVDEILRITEQAGYKARLKTVADEILDEPPFLLKKDKRGYLTVISGILILLGYGFSIFSPLLSTISFALAIVAGGFYVARSGFYSLKSLSLDMNFLMSIAAIGAAVIGEWEEGAMVVFLFSLGNVLQSYTMDKSRNSIRQLMDLSPKEASMKNNGTLTRVSVSQVKVNDIIIVKPGEKISMDGLVVKGESSVNQAPITGESMPVDKLPGDEVFAGSINERGTLEIKVTRLYKDNTLSKIIHLVEEAQIQKAPSQLFVDKFSRYYTPAVILLAVSITIIPSVFLGAPFIPWFYKALMLLVISCPCALVISTPVTIVSAIGSASKNGVLIKGGAFLEEAGALSVIAFDKTGTLTTGDAEVTDIIPLDHCSEEEILSIGASVEERSEHPVAKAIVKHAKKKKIKIAEPENFISFPGKGAQARINGETFSIGNLRFLKESDIPIDGALEKINGLQLQGKTVLIVSNGTSLLGLIALSDKARDISKKALEEIKEVGVKKIVMLTGDNKNTARAIATELGVDEFEADLLPQDKVRVINGLISRYGKVGMVGDGVNDAPALATASVGIAMGVAGTDIALETADIALMGDDLSKLSYTIKLSRKALKIIKHNIAISLIVKGIFLGLTFAGYANLWMAVIADTGTSLLVTANGMRLMTFGKKRKDDDKESEHEQECGCGQNHDEHEHEEEAEHKQECGCGHDHDNNNRV